MHLHLLERFTRCVSRCALFFVCSIFLVSITLLVIALFVRHPSQCLKDPIEGLDAESSELGAKLRHYRLFAESTTWQPRFTKVTTAYTAENADILNSKGKAQVIEFSSSPRTSRMFVNPVNGKTVELANKNLDNEDYFGGDVTAIAHSSTLSKQKQRLLDVQACAGWSEGGLLPKNSLPLPFRSAQNDDLLSPQSIWALCKLAARIEQSPAYGAVCRRRPQLDDTVVDEGSGQVGADHATAEIGNCCPVISIHTFVQLAFPNQDPCQHNGRVTLSQAESLRSDIFFCQRARKDPRFANESYPFCVDFKQQIASFMTFLADKQFLKETQALTISNIWLPMKEESESHDSAQYSAHDLEIVEELVDEIKEVNVSKKFEFLFHLPKSPSVLNAQRRRKMLDFAEEFPKSYDTLILIAIATASALIFLIAVANFSILRVVGMLFAYVCVFSCGYFALFVAQPKQPSFVGLFLPMVYVVLLAFDVFFNFNASMASAAAASKNDARTFQRTLIRGMQTAFGSLWHSTLWQSSASFASLAFVISDITVARDLCNFIAILSALIFLVLLIWLPASCALSFRNKQNISLPVIGDVDENPDTKVCCMSCELKCRSALQNLTFLVTPLLDRLVSGLTFAIVKFNSLFCIIPLLALGASIALFMYFGLSFDVNYSESSLISLFAAPLPIAVTNAATLIGPKYKTLFSYEDDKELYASFLKDTNRSILDPFYDCNNEFQRIAFVFRIDHAAIQNAELTDDILFSRETQLWFRRFCNESRHWLQAGGGAGDEGRQRVSVHPLRECAVERLIPYFEQRSCAAPRDWDGTPLGPKDNAPCCSSFKFPWEPAIYKQCIRQYVIDQIFKTGSEPNIDLRFSRDGTVETGFAVEYDVTFLADQQRKTNSSRQSVPDIFSCGTMLDFYEKTIAWFDNQLLSAPYPLRGSASVFVVSPQLTSQNLRLTAIRCLLFSVLFSVAMAGLGALIGTLNFVHGMFTFVIILIGTLLAASLVTPLQWQLSLYEIVLFAVFLVPIMTRASTLVVMTFRRYFYLLQLPGTLANESNFNVEPIARATLHHCFRVLCQSLCFCILLSVPLCFVTDFKFVERLAQFLAITSSTSVFMAIFGLLPLLTRFAFTAHRFGVASKPSKLTHQHHHHHHPYRQSPTTSSSPKSGSTSSGPISTSSSNEPDEPMLIPAISHQNSKPALKNAGKSLSGAGVRINGILINNNTYNGRQKKLANEARKVNAAELYGSGFFSTSKSSGNLSAKTFEPEKPAPGTSELIWVPRYPAAGVALEEFRVLSSPTPSDESPPLYASSKHFQGMATSWSANSTTFGVTALQSLEQEYKTIQPPAPTERPHMPLVAAKSFAPGDAVTLARTPAQSRSFQNGSTLTPLTDVDRSAFLYSPSYHTLGRNNGNTTATSSSFICRQVNQ